ncbi:MAG TPA: polysaccharide biosynthesis protein [Thermoleophilia bacterium]|nr:polysaccharide biosynthesis protein [Thermoleophilia bacterium]
MESADAVVAAMREAVPEGRGALDARETSALRTLTQALGTARPGAHQEYLRFQAVRDREIAVCHAEAAEWIGGRDVLVTGGTGCIGSMLMEQLARLGPRRLVSLSRGATAPRRRLPDAEYQLVDIRDKAALAEVFARTRPQVVFHLAAQRDPSLAEIEVHRTVTTNILGTRNVLELAVEREVPDVVVASTGKALRPYSPDVYAASKRAAEWLTARAAARGASRISAARFTHVVDNSIIARRLRHWCKSGVIRLHGTDIDFYVQSATESAQLLLNAGLGGRADVVRMHAIRDLGWPVNLLDLTLGMIVETRSQSPIYIAGYESGYERTPFPALYDPRTAGGISPLINMFEAASAVPDSCPQVDVFDMPAPSEDSEALLCLKELEETAQCTDESAPVRDAFDALSRALLDTTLRDVPKPALSRAVQLTAQIADTEAAAAGLEPAHRLLLAALRRWSEAG